MKTSLLLCTLMLLSAIFAPTLTFASHDGSESNDPRHGIIAPPSQPQQQGLEYSLESPLRSNIITIEGLLTTILNVLLVIAVPIIVFFIIFAGFTYVTAQGNPEKIKTATRSLTYAIIGAVLILGGVAISEIIASVVSSFQT
jgi:hypothetical protein